MVRIEKNHQLQDNYMYLMLGHLCLLQVIIMSSCYHLLITFA